MNPFLFCGVRIVGNCYLTKSEQARKHRKKRINKKWLKRYGYRQVPDLSCAYIMDDPVHGKTLICHPRLIDKLKLRIEREG